MNFFLPIHEKICLYFFKGFLIGYLFDKKILFRYNS
jgi:hypothetical protein